MFSRVAVLVLVLFGVVFAQEQPDWNPTCQVVFKYKLDDFLTEYQKRSSLGDSEAGQDQSAIYWANCKHKQNLKKLENFPKLKARLEQLGKLEYQFMYAESDLASQAAGGGTLYSHSANRFGIEVELHLERLIKLTTTKAGAVISSGIRARYKKANAELVARFKRVEHPSKAMLEYSSLKDWLETVKTYKSAFLGIKPILGNKIDAASLEIIEFLVRGIFAGEI